MRNLAGVADAGAYIVLELLCAGIAPELRADMLERSEVPTRVIGRLEPFTFERRWYYYSVSGRVPLAVAEELYADPIGQRDVRVAGHCGRPPPASWARHFDVEGTRVIVDPDGSRELQANAFFEAHPDLAEGRCKRYVRDIAYVQVESYVDLYHIDSQAGLNLFVATLRRHNLTGGA